MSDHRICLFETSEEEQASLKAADWYAKTARDQQTGGLMLIAFEGGRSLTLDATVVTIT